VGERRGEGGEDLEGAGERSDGRREGGEGRREPARESLVRGNGWGRRRVEAEEGGGRGVRKGGRRGGGGNDGGGEKLRILSFGKCHYERASVSKTRQQP